MQASFRAAVKTENMKMVECGNVLIDPLQYKASKV